MSARYELRPVGVFDSASGRDIRREDVEWSEYHAWLAAGNVPEAAPASAAPIARIDPITAGRDREQRQLQKLSEIDPLTAALVAGGLKRRPIR